MRELIERIRRYFASEVDESETQRHDDHRVDSMTAVDDQAANNTFPPGYVKSYDEGRPRK